MNPKIQQNLDALFTLCERATDYASVWPIWQHYGIDVCETVEASELWPVNKYGKMTEATLAKMFQYCVHIHGVRVQEALGRDPHQDRSQYYYSSLDAVVSLCESVVAWSRPLPPAVRNPILRQASYVLGAETAWDKLTDQVEHKGDGKKDWSLLARKAHAK